MLPEKKLLITIILLSAVTGSILAFVIYSLLPASSEKLIHDFYLSETASSISPSDYINHLASGQNDWILVDLRSSASYSVGHFVGAINIPAEGMSDAQLIAAYRALPANKTIVNYCYAEYCMLSRNVGLVLSNNGIYAKHMTAGGLEIMRDYSSYVVNGTSPGDYSSVHGGPLICNAGGGNFSC